MQKRYERNLLFPILPFGFVIGTKTTAAYEERSFINIPVEFIKAVRHFSSGYSDSLISIIIQWQNYRGFPFFHVLQNES
jgi:hypothetical protein